MNENKKDVSIPMNEAASRSLTIAIPIATLQVWTQAGSGKAKRIRSNGARSVLRLRQALVNPQANGSPPKPRRTNPLKRSSGWKY